MKPPSRWDVPTKVVRPLGDDEVDRPGVEAQQCVELTGTNRSRAYPVGWKVRAEVLSEVSGFEGMSLE